jgi:hypothetical protein
VAQEVARLRSAVVLGLAAVVLVASMLLVASLRSR